MALSAPGRLLDQVPEQRTELVGHRVARRVGHVDRAGTGTDDLAEDLRKKLTVGARRILRRELDVLDTLPGALHGPHRRVEHLLPRHLELVLQMDVRGRNEDVNARVPGPRSRPAPHARCRGPRVRARLRTIGPSTASATRLHGGEVALRGRRESPPR